ncbi:MAG: DUF3891 family protein [Anaerolineae bacterium]|nr:MAG: DUF3891 family protein [Anaerolineae bacterium]
MIRREFEGGLLLIPQTAHAWVAGQLALRWGNERFARPEPWDELMLVASQHDSGWAEWEMAPRIHPDGRPVGFMEMELEEHFAIWQRSVERMQPTSLYGALLISMHATFMYERRLQDDERGDTPEARQRMRGFVDEQRKFQEGIRHTLAGHPRYGPALEEQPLADAFRLLQIWDLLSLLLLLAPGSAGLLGPFPTNRLEDVPVAPCERATIQLTPRDKRTLTLEPYPFGEAPFTVRADGRWLAQGTFRHNALFRRALEDAQLVGLEISVDRAD